MIDGKQSTISVIIPIYNVEKYLAQCFDSLLAQTYSHFEILAIDDGSTDKSGQIADAYGKKDSRIKVFHQKNSGVSIARNVGLDNASGDYITFMDPDDWADENWLESQLETIREKNTDAAVCAHDAVYKNARVLEKTEIPHDLLLDYEERKNLTLGLGKWQGSAYNTSPVWTFLIKKECLINKVTGKPLRFILSRNYCEDRLFSLQAFRYSKVALNTKTLYHYRIRKTSLVNDLKYSFKVINSAVFSLKEGLINENDFLYQNASCLVVFSRINPKELIDWQLSIFQKTISIFREEKGKEYLKKNATKRIRLFSCFYLSKWPSFETKYRIMKYAYIPLKLLVHGISSIRLKKFD